jgi:hypothetical protein
VGRRRAMRNALIKDAKITTFDDNILMLHERKVNIVKTNEARNIYGE